MSATQRDTTQALLRAPSRTTSCPFLLLQAAARLTLLTLNAESTLSHGVLRAVLCCCRGWTVFTFGFAFLAPLYIFGKVSAKLNPAMCLAQWVWGNLTGVDFVCLSLAEFAGAFVGEAGKVGRSSCVPLAGAVCCCKLPVLLFVCVCTITYLLHHALC